MLNRGYSPQHVDGPWIIRQYTGFGTPEATNQRFRNNLSKGQTGLSVAFDPPTQTGYDPDHPMAMGDVGKVGVSIASIEDMQALMQGIPLDTGEHLDDHQCDRCLVARTLCRSRRTTGNSRNGTSGDHAKRYSQRVSGARNLHLPSRALDARAD